MLMADPQIRAGRDHAPVQRDEPIKRRLCAGFLWRIRMLNASIGAVHHVGALRSAEVFHKPWDVSRGDHPDLGWVHTVVVMSEHDSKTDHVGPWHLGHGGASLAAHRPSRFPDDLQQAFHGQLGDPVVVPGLPATLDHLGDLSGSVEDVGDPVVVCPAQRSTASAKILLSRSFRAPVDTMSTR